MLERSQLLAVAAYRLRGLEEDVEEQSQGSLFFVASMVKDSLAIASLVLESIALATGCLRFDLASCCSMIVAGSYDHVRVLCCFVAGSRC